MDIRSLIEKIRFSLRLMFPKYLKYNHVPRGILTSYPDIKFGNLPYKREWIKVYKTDDPSFRKSIPWYLASRYSDANIRYDLHGELKVIAPKDGKTEGVIMSNFTFKYGTVRAIIKTTDVSGVWSAFWLFDKNGMPEHDFEWCGQQKHSVHVTQHWGYDYDNNDKKSTLHNTRTNYRFNPTSEYNTYEIEKSPYKTIYRINGVVVKTMKHGLSSGESYIIFGVHTGSYCNSKPNQVLSKDAVMSIRSIELFKIK